MGVEKTNPATSGDFVGVVVGVDGVTPVAGFVWDLLWSGIVVVVMLERWLEGGGGFCDCLRHFRLNLPLR